MIEDIPGGIKRRFQSAAQGICHIDLLACSGHSGNHSLNQINLANSMVFGVGYIQGVIIGQGHSLRPGKAGLFKRPIFQKWGPVANNIQNGSFQVGHDKPVVVRICDEKAVIFNVGQNFSGE